MAVPCLLSDGSISTNDKRVIEHTASPYLLAFLLDHTRGCNEMMQYLRGNINVTLYVGDILLNVGDKSCHQNPKVRFRTLDLSPNYGPYIILCLRLC